MTDADISKLVSALYKSILNRDPSPEYLRTHSATIRDAGVSDGVAGLVKHFLSTSEFRKRFDDPEQLGGQLLINSSRIHLERLNKAFAQSIPPGSSILDVGAGAAPYRHLFQHANYESTDFQKVAKPYGQTTYVCDIVEGIPVEDGRFEFLLFNQTLEHLKEPERALKELYRILAPGGLMLCTAPLFYEEHEEPHDYFRYTQFGHRYLFQQTGFVIERLEWLEGFFGTCGYMLECIYKHAPLTVEGSSPESMWAKGFLAAFRPVALMAAGAFYRMDTMWKVTKSGFPKNYAVFARKPGWPLTP